MVESFSVISKVYVSIFLECEKKCQTSLMLTTSRVFALLLSISKNHSITEKLDHDFTILTSNGVLYLLSTFCFLLHQLVGHYHYFCGNYIEKVFFLFFFFFFCKVVVFAIVLDWSIFTQVSFT